MKKTASAPAGEETRGRVPRSSSARGAGDPVCEEGSSVRTGAASKGIRVPPENGFPGRGGFPDRQPYPVIPRENAAAKTAQSTAAYPAFPADRNPGDKVLYQGFAA